MPLVLVVDDVKALAEQYAYDLARLGRYRTAIATGGSEALEIIESQPVDCMILDLEMPGVDGFDVLRFLKKRSLDIPVIVYTGTGNYERCVQAVKLGAYSFIDKSESMEKVVREVENALEKATLQAEVEALRRDLAVDAPLVGKSRVMVELKERIVRLAPIPSPVLVVGESGSGKELVARELHRLSPRATRPFVAVNCAALTEALVESELFGHEKGAFTGADRLHRGAFERAEGGTLFLDEVGELPLSTQAKLLRVLEEDRLTRVGGEKPIGIRSRVVAATNRDLEEEVERGRFRQDLFYRLNVHLIEVPPLRDRRSDIPELAAHLAAEACRRFGLGTKRILPEAMEYLIAYEWRRNNVRELRNVIERMVIASEGEVIGSETIPAEIKSSVPVPPNCKRATFQQLKAEAERRIIIEALERNDWHISKTAKELGLADHSSLLKIMRRHNIKKGRR